jgi:DnaJ homolog subfamily C member 8
MLHPDKHQNDPRAQQAFEEVKKAKNHVLSDRARHSQMVVEEGIKRAEAIFKQNPKGQSLEQLKEKEVMRLFADIEQKRREVQERERKFEQRTQQQEDDEEAKERQARQFDKSWRKEDRVDKRVGNWRDFAQAKKKPKT